MTKVVILCGGQGTRLREETEYKPKPMIQIGNRPILWHIMKHYSHFNLQDFVLCLGYKAEIIKEYFYNYSMMNNDFTIKIGAKSQEVLYTHPEEVNWQVSLVNTGLNAMTGFRIKSIEPYIDGDYFLATYGDAVADIDIDELIKFHKKTGKIATLTGIKPPSKYGILETEKDFVTRFNEKPQAQDFVNGGFFVFEKEIFKYIDDNESCVLEGKPLEKLASEGQLAIYKHDGFWQCMDTYRDFEHLNSMYKSGNTPWMLWDNEKRVLES